MKLVMVGGVAAGASVAARARRLDELAEIIVLEQSGNVSFANCGLPVPHRRRRSRTAHAFCCRPRRACASP